MLDRIIWREVRTPSLLVEGLPMGIRRILESDFDTVAALPETRSGASMRPVIEEVTFESDYLEFLERQVESYESLDREWSVRLARRLEAFKDRVGEKLVRMHLYDGTYGATFWFQRANMVLIHCEWGLTIGAKETGKPDGTENGTGPITPEAGDDPGPVNPSK